MCEQFVIERNLVIARSEAFSQRDREPASGATSSKEKRKKLRAEQLRFALQFVAQDRFSSRNKEIPPPSQRTVEFARLGKSNRMKSNRAASLYLDKYGPPNDPRED
jgi:hypothetical protein